ncbi:transmembrane protein 128 [Tanacetum coccineum]
MSGGTPTAGGLMRQRHSQGYASSGDDLEDDACSRIRPQSPTFPVKRTWVEVLENVVWIASAVLIVYLGDWNSNLVYILFHDGRIRRVVLLGRRSFSTFGRPEAASLPLAGVGLSTSKPPHTLEDGIGTHNPWKTVLGVTFCS